MRKALQFIIQPYRWQSSVLKKNTIIRILCIMLIFFVISLLCNRRWEFPHFYLFFTTFTGVLLLALFSEIRYTVQINRIRAQTANKSGFRIANSKFLQFEQSKWVGVIALIVVCIFGVGGVAIYGAIAITPTLIVCLVYFSIVVYLSLVGYVQYILLFAYIIFIAQDKAEFKRVEQELTNTLPAEINWLHGLTKLTHFYRSTFFTVGTFYIAAFWFYCSSPQFDVLLGHWLHYVLWAIIFIAIVVIFPLVSIIEFNLIKKLVTKVKCAYIEEIKLSLQESGDKTKLTVEHRILGEVFSSSILQSSGYPITNRLGIAYAAALAVLNLVGSIDTAIHLGNQLLVP
ncbi:MAG: hypothetical protein QM697_14495 [Lachnospiraceae bacterium]